MNSQFAIHGRVKVWLAIACGILVLARAGLVFAALTEGDEGPLLAFPLAVIVPAVLIALLLAMQPTGTREGLLMRVGTLLQLLFVIALPPVALYLALGLPVVFLVVEFVETRVPPGLRNRLAEMWMA